MLGVALAALAVKLFIAATTGGTNDVRHFQRYAEVVGRVGPIRVYGDEGAYLYNHGPVTSLLLVLISWLRDLGVPVRFTIRAIPAIADVGSAVLVFAIARARMPLERARAIGIAGAASPVLLFISGFHGNTDPFMTFLIVLSLYLLLERDAAVASGIAFGLALATKLVPVVAVPALLVSARARRHFFRVAIPIGVVFVGLWLPAVLTETDGVRERVFSYVAPFNGWGILEIARRAGSFSAADDLLRGPFVYVILTACAAAGAFVASRHRLSAYAGVAVALIAFLAISPGWGAQYLAWIVPLGYLAWPRFATAYAIVGGAFLFAAYTHWSRGLPWDHAFAGLGLGWPGSWLGLATWCVLVAWTVVAVATATRRAMESHGPLVPEPELAVQPTD